jgi:hypothetical protein
VHIHLPKPLHGWREFVGEVGVIAIGILIALGAEQAVEVVHHNQQRSELLDAMNKSFVADAGTLAQREQSLLTLDNYVAELGAAVAARIDGKPAKVPDAESDPRNQTFVPPPNFGPYEAAKANGSLGLLDLRMLRIYARIDFQHGLMLANFQRFFFQLGAVRAFSRRHTVAHLDDRSRLAAVDIDRLSSDQLGEYRRLLAELDEDALAYAGQLRRLRVAYRTILDGSQDEAAILKAVGESSGIASNIGSTPRQPSVPGLAP